MRTFRSKKLTAMFLLCILIAVVNASYYRSFGEGLAIHLSAVIILFLGIEAFFVLRPEIKAENEIERKRKAEIKRIEKARRLLRGEKTKAEKVEEIMHKLSNMTEKNIIIIALSIITLSFIYVPWYVEKGSYSNRVSLELGYDFVWSPPTPNDRFYLKPKIDYSRVVMSTIGIIFLTSTIIIYKRK